MIPYDILEEGQKSDQRFLEAEGKGLTAALHGRVFPGDANSLLVVVVTGLYTFVKAHQTERPRGVVVVNFYINYTSINLH